MKELKFNFSNIPLEKQLVKVQEELWELIKAVTWKEWNIQNEMWDVIISVYWLSQILNLNYEDTIKKCIHKINNRSKNKLELKPYNEWRPTHPEIIINPKKWGYNKDGTLDPQACEHEWNWYYNFPAAQLLEWVPAKEQWGQICKPYWNDWERLSKELWLTMAGYRYRSTGLYYSQSTYGLYWSSSPSTTNAFRMGFLSANVRPTNADDRADGFSVRCIKN